MHIYYADESYDSTKFVLSALGLKVTHWRQALDKIKQFRKGLRQKWGIKLRAQLHARTFIRHCSDRVSTKKLSLADRRQVFEECLDFICTLPVKITNVCLTMGAYGQEVNKAHEAALDRLYNRIQATMANPLRNSYAVVIFDRGKEVHITRLSRRMSVVNFIPSQFGAWPGGKKSRNIVIDRVIEDPVFRFSGESYFLQLVDFAAFALLKREVPPTPFIQRHGYHQLFPKLVPVLFRGASPREVHGIVRT